MHAKIIIRGMKSTVSINDLGCIKKNVGVTLFAVCKYFSIEKQGWIVNPHSRNNSLLLI
jgi:hypothetical protein